MTLDNEQQRKFLLEMMQQVNFPGSVLDLAYEVKRAIAKASLNDQETMVWTGNGVVPKPHDLTGMLQPQDASVPM